MEWREVSFIDIESKAACRVNLFGRMGFEKKAEFCAISCSRCTFGGRLHLREKEMIGEVHLLVSGSDVFISLFIVDA